MNPSTIYGQANNVYNQGLQGGDQANQQYQTDTSQAQGANQNLTNYQQSLSQPQNQLGNVYQQNLQSADQMYGVNPQELQQAQATLAQTQNVMAALPQSIQQGANGRGVTAAQEANRYSQAAQGTQQQVTNQANAVGQLQQGVGYAQNAANQQTGFTGQSQQLQVTALNQIYQNALAQQSQANQQLQYYRQLEASGVQLSEGEQQSQAALTSAAAQAQQAAAQAATAYFNINQTKALESAVQSAFPGKSAAMIMAGLQGGASMSTLDQLMGVGQTPGTNSNTTIKSPGALQSLEKQLGNYGPGLLSALTQFGALTGI